ncbi:MAG: hypothetical protein Hyperionvirus4_94 [Hyperionvirus sp.]|uniref:Uncharacterized protein n=1 Tax=Hyperionvirus sp. TaxID=2487770 RepID=A0A3G5ACQ7_9VIRU|nr:MAG: hypothetical protein Hyperionvirus4_94 [Hyperionvirus sp.]
MTFPEVDPQPSVPIPIFASYCIDYRYDALASNYLREIGFPNSYYLATNAGAALPLGYKKSCKNIKCNCESEAHQHCCPGTDEMDNLKKSFVTNLQIALTLRPIEIVYLLNHQECGAIRAFLPCSGYPQLGEQNKHNEKCINAKILTYAREYVKKKFGNMTVQLGLLDSNGTVADYNVELKQWVIMYVGPSDNPDGLWFGYNQGETIPSNCDC